MAVLQLVLDLVFMFIFAVALIALALAMDSPVLSFFGGAVSLMLGFELIGTVWIALVFWGLGIYFMVAGAMPDR